MSMRHYSETLRFLRRHAARSNAMMSFVIPTELFFKAKDGVITRQLKKILKKGRHVEVFRVADIAKVVGKSELEVFFELTQQYSVPAFPIGRTEKSRVWVVVNCHGLWKYFKMHGKPNLLRKTFRLIDVTDFPEAKELVLFCAHANSVAKEFVDEVNKVVYQPDPLTLLKDRKKLLKFKRARELLRSHSQLWHQMLEGNLPARFVKLGDRIFVPEVIFSLFDYISCEANTKMKLSLLLKKGWQFIEKLKVQFKLRTGEPFARRALNEVLNSVKQTAKLFVSFYCLMDPDFAKVRKCAKEDGFYKFYHTVYGEEEADEGKNSHDTGNFYSLMMLYRIKLVNAKIFRPLLLRFLDKHEREAARRRCNIDALRARVIRSGKEFVKACYRACKEVGKKVVGTVIWQVSEFKFRLPVPEDASNASEFLKLLNELGSYAYVHDMETVPTA